MPWRSNNTEGPQELPPKRTSTTESRNQRNGSRETANITAILPETHQDRPTGGMPKRSSNTEGPQEPPPKRTKTSQLPNQSNDSRETANTTATLLETYQDQPIGNTVPRDKETLGPSTDTTASQEHQSYAETITAGGNPTVQELRYVLNVIKELTRTKIYTGRNTHKDGKPSAQANQMPQITRANDATYGTT